MPEVALSERPDRPTCQHNTARDIVARGLTGALLGNMVGLVHGASDGESVGQDLEPGGDERE